MFHFAPLEIVLVVLILIALGLILGRILRR